MPKIVVEIEWDYPNEQHWLNVYNIEGVLNAHCKNTTFKVVEIEVQRHHGPRETLSLADAALVLMGAQ